MEAITIEVLENEDLKAVVFGADQPEYLPLPAIVSKEGWILTEWKLSEAEIDLLKNGENIRLWIYNFGQPLQPVMLEVTGENK